MNLIKARKILTGSLDDHIVKNRQLRGDMPKPSDGDRVLDDLVTAIYSDDQEKISGAIGMALNQLARVGLRKP